MVREIAIINGDPKNLVDNIIRKKQLRIIDISTFSNENWSFCELSTMM